MSHFPDIDPVRGRALMEQAAQLVFGKPISELTREELLQLADVSREAAAIRYENDFQAIVAGMEIP